MKSVRYQSQSVAQTIKFACSLAHCLRKGDILCLYGNLGSGKTTFTKGIARGLKINQDTVNSPTFVLLNEYKGKLPLFHFDLYRIGSVKEIALIGYEEYFFNDGVCVVEWAEKLNNLTPDDYLGIEFTPKGQNKRSITITPHGLRSKKTIERFKK